jgi:hypothetical protein
MCTKTPTAVKHPCRTCSKGEAHARTGFAVGRGPACNEHGIAAHSPHLQGCPRWSRLHWAELGLWGLALLLVGQQGQLLPHLHNRCTHSMRQHDSSGCLTTVYAHQVVKHTNPWLPVSCCPRHCGGNSPAHHALHLLKEIQLRPSKQSDA